ncbi:MAG: RNA polymerase sigma factor, partial [Polyangiaceae bacterium]
TPDDDEISSHEIGASALYSDMPQLPDQDALVLLRKRNERGFDLIYERYAERIFGFLVRLSRSRAVAEDLLQHTFLRLAEVGPHLRPDSDVRAWLFAVARNAYRSHARLRGAEAHFEPSVSWPSLTEASGAATGPEVGLAVQELERALARLSTEDRELLLLVGVEGLSYAEMGLALGLDVVAIRKRVSRARGRLAQILDEQPAVVRKSLALP